ncbi:hypothetical protein GCM10019994_19890 [Enterococcus raffinosus]|nr:hypothetical protein NUITMVRE36_17110 [Enterococcus raffinosus]
MAINKALKEIAKCSKIADKRSSFLSLKVLINSFIKYPFKIMTCSQYNLIKIVDKKIGLDKSSIMSNDLQ